MVAVNYGRFFGLDWLCYLDDRLMMDFDKTIVRRFGHLQPQNAIRGLALIVAGGGFISLDKSELVPTTKIQFLGMELDTINGTISVPDDKWLKFSKILRIRTLGSERDNYLGTQVPGSESKGGTRRLEIIGSK